MAAEPPEATPSLLAADLAAAIRAAGEASANEQQLLIAAETALRPVLEALEVPSHPE